MFNLLEHECPCSYIDYFFLGEFDFFFFLIEFLCSLLLYWVNIYDQMSFNGKGSPGNGLALNVPQTIP